MRFNKQPFSQFDTILCVGFVFIAAVSAVSSADEVTLKGGDVIHGTVIQRDEDGILLEHEDLGLISIAPDRVASVLVAPDEVMQTEDQAEVEPETGPPAPKHLIKELEFEKLSAFSARAKENGWSSSIDASLTSETGNTDERSYRIGLKIGKEYSTENSDVKATGDLSYYNKNSDGETTDDSLTVGYVHDRYFKDSDWFTFILGRYDYDLFESWRHRAALHVGPGYKLIHTPDFWLDLRAGPGLRKEWGSEASNLDAEGVGGTSFEWKPTAKQIFTFSSLAYAVLDDFSDYRTRTVFEWDYLLDDEMNLSFVVGIKHEYQAVVDPGKKKNDTRVHTGIRFKF